MIDVLLYFTFLAGLVPAILFYSLDKIKREKIYYAQPFVLLMALASVCEPVATLWLGVASQHWFRIYNLLEFLSLHYFFSKLLGTGYKWLFRVFIAIFFVAVIVLFFILNVNQLKLETFYAPFIFLFVILCSVLWLRKIFIAAALPLLGSPSFYFICGFFFYYSNTFLFYFLSEIIIVNYRVYYKAYWIINIIATLIQKLIMCIGIWKARRM